jgi:hypothetical protein
VAKEQRVLKTEPRVSFHNWRDDNTAEPPALWAGEGEGGSIVSMRALIGQKWDPECWDGDMWRDHDAVGNTEPLGSDEAVGAVLSSAVGISPALLKSLQVPSGEGQR